jgi:hypothetical protein
MAHLRFVRTFKGMRYLSRGALGWQALPLDNGVAFSTARQSHRFKQWLLSGSLS